MKEILMSLSPYWYYLIGEGIKRIEVRSRIPKDQDWNKKMECYMAKNKKSFNRIPKEFQEKYKAHFGKVGMQFMCDKIDELCVIGEPYKFLQVNNEVDLSYNAKTCLTINQYEDYLGYGILGYGLHITDLKIYDKPRELEDFIKPCIWANGREKHNTIEHCKCFCGIERPPQSWCYVEEL